jgi:hypothetical protein
MRYYSSILCAFDYSYRTLYRVQRPSIYCVAVDRRKHRLINSSYRNRSRSSSPPPATKKTSSSPVPSERSSPSPILSVLEQLNAKVELLRTAVIDLREQLRVLRWDHDSAHSVMEDDLEDVEKEQKMAFDLLGLRLQRLERYLVAGHPAPASAAGSLLPVATPLPAFAIFSSLPSLLLFARSPPVTTGTTVPMIVSSVNSALFSERRESTPHSSLILLKVGAFDVYASKSGKRGAFGADPNAPPPASGQLAPPPRASGAGSIVSFFQQPSLPAAQPVRGSTAASLGGLSAPLSSYPAGPGAVQPVVLAHQPQLVCPECASVRLILESLPAACRYDLYVCFDCGAGVIV